MSISGTTRKAIILSLCLGACIVGSLFASIQGSQVASSKTTNHTQQSRKIALNWQDNGKTITAQVGDTVEISLDENRTTGYSWAVDNTDEQLAPLQSTSFHGPSGPARIGAGGTRIYTFVAQEVGTDRLFFRYWRSWEGDSSIAQRFDVTLQVQES